MRVWELFWRFLVLGLISFGGPSAHIGYFRTAFVEKLRWLDDASYARLIALSQFLPGPGSSQIGFAIGMRRAGLLGGVAAFIGFTLPSFLLMYAVATISFEPTDIFNGMIHGLKLFALIVVADAALGMYRSFCKTRSAVTLMVTVTVIVWLFPSTWTQIGLLIAAALFGIFFLPTDPNPSAKVIHPRFFPLILFGLLLVSLPFLAHWSPWVNLFSLFYQSGSLVFGGGHVVLPLLQHSLGESIGTERFLFGYALAQTVPGPMFTLSAFLGADVSPSAPLMGALVATLAIFLPGFLLVSALASSWEYLAHRPRIAAAAAGINAAVVGLLAATLYDPVFTNAITSAVDMAFAVAGFFALRIVRVPIVGLLPLFALLGVIIS